MTAKKFSMRDWNKNVFNMTVSYAEPATMPASQAAEPQVMLNLLDEMQKSNNPQEYKARWSATFNSLLAQPVCPPEFKEVMLASPWPVSDAQWISPANQRLTVRRALRLMVDLNDAQALQIMHSISGCPAPMLGEELCRWYSVEPDPLNRRRVLSDIPSMGNNPTQFKPLLELAKQDWDEKNKSLADEALKNLKP
jgi:hypothetical protein